MTHLTSLLALITLCIATVSGFIPGLVVDNTRGTIAYIIFMITFLIFGMHAFSKQHKGVAIFSFICSAILLCVLVFMLILINSWS